MGLASPFYSKGMTMTALNKISSHVLVARYEAVHKSAIRMLRLAIQQRDVAFSYAYKPRAYHVPEANEDLLKAGEG